MKRERRNTARIDLHHQRPKRNGPGNEEQAKGKASHLRTFREPGGGNRGKAKSNRKANGDVEQRDPEQYSSGNYHSERSTLPELRRSSANDLRVRHTRHTKSADRS